MRAIILEDDRDRRVAMTQRLVSRFPFLQIQFFESASRMITALERNTVPDIVVIALDNDLEMMPHPSGNFLDPGTGLDVAEWLSQLPAPFCPVIVHTTNTPYGDKMTTSLKEAGWKVQRVVPHNDLEWVNEEWFFSMRNAIVEHAPTLLLTEAEK